MQHVLHGSSGYSLHLPECWATHSATQLCCLGSNTVRAAMRKTSVMRSHSTQLGAGRLLQRSMAIVLLGAAGLLVGGGARADDPGAARFSWSAFGTLGAVHSSERRADFTSSLVKPNGAGYTHNWSTDVDSRLGGQLLARVVPRLSAVVQVVAEQSYDNTYRPHVEWANLKYELTPQLTVRAGRIVLPSFMFADTRKVGYANPWVRPPVELYNLVPVTNSDGVDVSYEVGLGAFAHRVTASYGKTGQGLPPTFGYSVHATDLWLLSDTIEYGDATFRVALENGHLHSKAVADLFDALRNFG